MWPIFEASINFFQGFLMIFFMRQRLPGGRDSRWWVEVAFEVIIGCVLCLYSFCPLPFSDILVFILPFYYTAVEKKGTWLQRFFWTLVLGAVFTVVTVLSGNAYSEVFGIELSTLMESSVLRLGYVVTTNVAIAVVLISVARIGRDENDSLMSCFSLAIFITSLLLQFATIEILYIYQIRGHNDDHLMVIADICILALVMMTLLLYEIVAQTVKNKHLAELKLQTIMLSQQHQHDMLAIYSEMLAAQHDLRHQVNMVRQLVSKTSFVEKEKVLNLLNEKSGVQDLFITGCSTVDAILTAKRAVAEQNGIMFLHQPYPLQHLPMDETTFCILLSNILDNAIEAICRMPRSNVEPKVIELQFARSWNMFYITCRNTMDPATIRRQGERFLSAKDDAHFHGFGIENIKQAVTQNLGLCDFSAQGTQFVVSITLPDEG